jgi:hypothetical protein
MYAFFAFVCGSLCVHGILYLDVNIMVGVSMLRTAEEGKLRLPPRYLLEPGNCAAYVHRFITTDSREQR